MLEGSNLRGPLQELHQMVMTPIKAFVGGEEGSAQRPLLCSDGKSAAPGSHLNSGGGGGEAELSSSAVAEGDLPGQFTRVMGKGVCVCTRARRHAAAVPRFCLAKANLMSCTSCQFAPSCWCRGPTRTASAPTCSSSTSASSTRCQHRSTQPVV